MKRSFNDIDAPVSCKKQEVSRLSYVPGTIDDNFVIRFAKQSNMKVFAVYKKWQIDQCDSEYLKAWVRMGLVDFQFKTITLPTLMSAEIIQALVHSEIQGCLPEQFHDFDGHAFQSIADLMLCETLIKRTYLIDRTTFNNGLNLRVVVVNQNQPNNKYETVIPVAIAKQLDGAAPHLLEEMPNTDPENRMWELTLNSDIPKGLLEALIYLDFHKAEKFNLPHCHFPDTHDLQVLFEFFDELEEIMDDLGFFPLSAKLHNDLIKSIKVEVTNLEKFKEMAGHQALANTKRLVAWLADAFVVAIQDDWISVSHEELVGEVQTPESKISLINIPLILVEPIWDIDEDLWIKLANTTEETVKVFFEEIQRPQYSLEHGSLELRFPMNATTQVIEKHLQFVCDNVIMQV
jgi:hypothetical protein